VPKIASRSSQLAWLAGITEIAVTPREATRRNDRPRGGLLLCGLGRRPGLLPHSCAVPIRRLLIRALMAAAVAALLAPAAASAGARKVPRGWLGATLTPSIVARHGTLDREFAQMRRSGVETVRVAVYWFDIQPKRHKRPDFSSLDTLVRTAAAHRLPLLPVVLGAPRWATSDDYRPIPVPRHASDYAAFVTRLVRRYGPHGGYWRSHRHVRKVPIRSWQIWNEVSNPYYWDESTWTSAYPKLLRAAYDAVKGVDPGARVLMAGLNTGGSGLKDSLPSWEALGRIYDGLDAQGLGRPFDATAAHVYTSTVSDAVKVVRNTRRVMNAHGDEDRDVDVTELAWPASKGKLRDGRGRHRTFFAETDKRGMARRLSKGVTAFARLRTTLGIGSVEWYQWISSYYGTTDAFNYAGLRRAHKRNIEDMPALRAFRAVAGRLEGRKLPR
jgi:nuclear transport factor 2 (NTF2) superfamily protein